MASLRERLMDRLGSITSGLGTKPPMTPIPMMTQKEISDLLDLIDKEDERNMKKKSKKLFDSEEWGGGR